MVAFALEPPERIGPIQIGSTLAEATASIPGPVEVEPFQRDPDDPPGVIVDIGDLGVFLYGDTTGRVDAVEIGRPGLPGEVTEHSITWNGVDVFTTPVAEIASLLRSTTELKIAEEGSSFTAPALLLAFWRGGDDHGVVDSSGECKYFESVLIARPGYYD